MEKGCPSQETKARLFIEARKYADILAIFNRMDQEGYLAMLQPVIENILRRESEYTIQELRKYQHSCSPAEQFDTIDHFVNNSQIFKKNLVLITNLIIEDVLHQIINDKKAPLNRDTPSPVTTATGARQKCVVVNLSDPSPLNEGSSFASSKSSNPMVELIGEDDENDTSKGNELRLSTRMSRASVVQSGLESLPSGKSIEPRIIGENSKARANILQSGKENEGVGRNNSMRGKKSRKAKNDATKGNKSILTRVDKVLTTQLTLPNIKNRSKSNSLKDMQTEKRLTDRAVNEVRLFHTDRVRVSAINV
eukprot:TRINITY_DN927_c0_g2_i1.p1 TRINITY_DN927_c0_g2~~TRINITY_DN927_c0_g2_i1.p1  ORF type:complete len:308 (-),score=67.62 TRINITY_DN927_c0_g2_i1:31-954(-)